MSFKRFLTDLGLAGILSFSGTSFAQDDFGKGIYTFKFGDKTVKVRHLSSFKEPYLSSERSLLLSQEKKDPTQKEYRLGLTRQEVPVSGTGTSLDGKILTEKDVQFLAIDLDEKDAENGNVKRKFFNSREVVPLEYFDGRYIILGVIKEDNPSELFNFQPVYKVFASTAREGGKSLEEMANAVEEVGIVVAEHAKQPEPEVKIVERVVEKIVERIVEKPVIQYVEKEVIKPKEEERIVTSGRLGYSPISLEFSLPDGSVTYIGSELDVTLNLLFGERSDLLIGPYIQFRRAEFSGNSELNTRNVVVVRDNPISLIKNAGDNDLEAGVLLRTPLWRLNKLYFTLGVGFKNENLTQADFDSKGSGKNSYGLRTNLDFALHDLFGFDNFRFGLDADLNLQGFSKEGEKFNGDYHLATGPTFIFGPDSTNFSIFPAIVYHSQVALENDQRKEFLGARGRLNFYEAPIPLDIGIYIEKSFSPDIQRLLFGIDTRVRNLALGLELQDTEVDLGRKDKFKETSYLFTLTGQTEFRDPQISKRSDRIFPRLK